MTRTSLKIRKQPAKNSLGNNKYYRIAKSGIPMVIACAPWQDSSE
jgi:hypothetical protein